MKTLICFLAIALGISSCGIPGNFSKKTTIATDSIETPKKLTDQEQLVEWLDQLQQDWGTKKYKDIGDGNFSMDVPFKEDEDGVKRYQWVTVSLAQQVAENEDIWDIRSMGCELTNKNLDVVALLDDAKYGYYSMICIRDKKNNDAGPKGAVYVQSGPLVKHCNNYEMFKFIVFEVARNADFLDKKYNLGGDEE